MTQMEVLTRMLSSAKDDATKATLTASIEQLRVSGTAESPVPTVHESEFMKGYREFKDQHAPSKSSSFGFPGYPEETPAPSRELRDLMRGENMIATTSMLAGTVCKDGFIFNPYIHRTHLPISVCRLASDIWAAEECLTPTSYRHAIILYLQGYRWGLLGMWNRSGVSNSLEFTANSKTRVTQEQLERQVARMAESRTESLTYRLARQMGLQRLVFNLLLTIQREMQVLQNMVDHDSLEHVQERFGMDADNAHYMFDEILTEILDQFFTAQCGIKDFVIDSIITSEIRVTGRQYSFDRTKLVRLMRTGWDTNKLLSMHNDGFNWYELPGMQFYTELGVRGTLRSLCLFPERYKNILGAAPDLAENAYTVSNDGDDQLDILLEALSGIFKQSPPDTAGRSRFF